jgi:hypothetical protein
MNKCLCHCEMAFSRRSNPLLQEEIASQSTLAMTFDLELYE